jgi:hypothetical protein
VTETIESMAAQIDQQQLAQELVEQARAQGVELVGQGVWVPNWSSISSDLGVFRRVRVLGAKEAGLVVTIVAPHGGLAVRLEYPRWPLGLPASASWLLRPVRTRTLLPALAEPVTAVITDALPRTTEGFTTGTPSSPPGAHQISALTCWFSEPRVEQRRQLGITVGAWSRVLKPPPAGDQHRGSQG